MTLTEPRQPRDRGSLHVLEAPPDDDLQPAEPDVDIPAERAVLGAMLRGPESLDQATQIVTSAHLWRPQHQAIFDAAVALYSRGRPVDTITVANQLGPAQLRKAGGQAYLEQLHVDAFHVVDVTYYAHIVHELAGRRLLRQHHQRGLQDLEQHTEATVGDLIDRTRTHLDELPRGVPGVDHDTPTTSWAAVDLTGYLDGTIEPPSATRMQRRDGKCLLYPYAVHSIAGEPGSGKTWAALIAIAQDLHQGHDAGMIDFEDRATTAISRLLALGCTIDQIRDHFRYIRPDQAIDPAAGRELDAAIATCATVIIDGITEAMNLHGLAVNDNDDVARWLHLLPNRIADIGPAVLQIDHVTKDADTRGRYALGAQHKLAGITGVAYKLVTIKSMGKGVRGHAKLVIDKDKHGDVGPNGLTVADLHLDATDAAGRVYGWLEEPGQDTDPSDGHFRPTTLMKRVSTHLMVNPGASLNEIRAGVRGKSTSIADAVNALILEGHIRTESGPRGTVRHYLEKAFGDDES